MDRPFRIPSRSGSIAMALAVGLLVALLAVVSADAAVVKIVAPKKVEAPENAPYAVSAPGPANKIAFYVDGQRRWVENSSYGHFDRTGYLATARLAAGRHLLTVKTKRGSQITKRSRNFYVTRGRKSTGERGKRKQEEPAPTPAPIEEPAPAGTEEAVVAPAGEPAPATEEPAPADEGAAPPPSGNVLFNNTFDGSFSGWYVQSLASRAAIVSGSPFQGTGNARFEVREGDVEPDTGSQRSEVSGPTFNEGQDIYVRDAFRIPSSVTYQGPWQIIQQLHETNWSGSPGIAVFLWPDHSIQLGAGDGSPTYWKSAKLQTDRWYELIYRVNLSRSASNGFVEVWLDGSQQTLLNGSTRSYGQTIQTSSTYLKAGIYRSSSSTGVSLIEHDDISVATSLAALPGV